VQQAVRCSYTAFLCHLMLADYYPVSRKVNKSTKSPQGVIAPIDESPRG